MIYLLFIVRISILMRNNKEKNVLLPQGTKTSNFRTWHAQLEMKKLILNYSQPYKLLY